MGEVAVAQLVSSQAGRDAPRKYLVIQILDEAFVTVADGQYRKISNPKRKNIKHLEIHPHVVEPIQQAIKQGDKVTNQQIRRAIHQFSELTDHGREEGSTANGER